MKCSVHKAEVRDLLAIAGDIKECSARVPTNAWTRVLNKQAADAIVISLALFVHRPTFTRKWGVLPYYCIEQRARLRKEKAL